MVLTTELFTMVCIVEGVGMFFLEGGKDFKGLFLLSCTIFHPSEKLGDLLDFGKFFNPMMIFKTLFNVAPE